MKYLSIKNKGLLDENIIFLMGASTKTEDNTKIGQFGTGLKYSLAWLLRNNIDFKIFIGENEVKISTLELVTRGQKFDVITVDGKETSITTTMGLDWKAWMILRELWCNALDEGDAVKEVVESIVSKANETTFFIQLTGEILTAYNDWTKYFNTREPISECDYYGRVFQSQGNTMKIYRKGILVKEYENTTSVFDYDFPHAAINELREYVGYLDYDISQALSYMDKKGVSYFIDNIDEDKKEAKIDVMFADFNTWKDALGNAKIISYDSFSALSAMKPESMQGTNYLKLPAQYYKRLVKCIDGISALMVSDDAHSFFETFDQKLDGNLKQAMVILESCDYYVDSELKFIMGIFNDKSVLGRINLKERTVMISTSLRDMGLKELIYVIVEETEHFRTNYSDKTREFQTHFIELYTNKLLETSGIKL